MYRFYWQWFSNGFRHSIGIGDGVAFLLGVLIPVILHFVPELKPAISNLLWQIPLGIFVAVVLVRLFLAPYWMHKDLSATVSTLNKDKNELQADLQIANNRIQELEIRLTGITSVPEELAASHLQNLSFRIADLARESTTIRHKVFENCHIYGPALIYPRNSLVIHSTFEGTEEETFVITTNKSVMGAICLEDCTIRNCTLYRIGFIGTSEQISKIKPSSKYQAG